MASRWRISASDARYSDICDIAAKSTSISSPNALCVCRPVLLFDGKVTSKIEGRYLANLAADAFTAHQAIGEVALFKSRVVSSGSTDKHSLIYRKSKRENYTINNIMAQQKGFRQVQKQYTIIINSLKTQPNKNIAKIGRVMLKMG